MDKKIYKQILKDLKKIPRFESYEVDPVELDFYKGMQHHLTHPSAMLIPHESQYNKTLKQIAVDDVVYDAGAGCMAFPFMVAQKAKKVYAVEFNPAFIQKALAVIGYHMPRNLVMVCADWFDFTVPHDVTVVTCLVNSPMLPVLWEQLSNLKILRILRCEL